MAELITVAFISLGIASEIPFLHSSGQEFAFAAIQTITWLILNRLRYIGAILRSLLAFTVSVCISFLFFKWLTTNSIHLWIISVILFVVWFILHHEDLYCNWEGFDTYDPIGFIGKRVAKRFGIHKKEKIIYGTYYSYKSNSTYESHDSSYTSSGYENRQRKSYSKTANSEYDNTSQNSSNESKGSSNYANQATVTNTFFAGCNTLNEIRHRYRVLVKKYHPDNGGNTTDFSNLQNAYARACKAFC
ncbi:J domain-containing protein [Butyrivibrio sp. AC2005]|uniref:J domain-containing protein n=1 Tax=Butyrivibrio sp. AC2005 TaxID=1280672 RepID=UPI00040F91F6|nr:J domain-containing protein [Butyrivibrio sp. AC2005]